MTVDKNHYSAYDLHLSSVLSLPELPATDPEGSPVDVHIQKGRVTPVPVDDDAKGHIQAARDTCRMTYNGIGSVRIDGGSKIIYDINQPAVAEMKIFRRIIMNQALAILLFQQGLLVLHASAVVVDEKAVVFLGGQTAGKSTTAAAFHQDGYEVLADDVVAIRFDKKTPYVVPGVPEIRLTPDAVAELGIEEATQPTGDWGPEKLYYRLSGDRSPTPLFGCYLLEDGESVEIVDQSGQKSFLNLVGATYTRGMVGKTDQTAKHFNQCRAVVNTTTMQTLKRPKKIEEISRIVDSVSLEVSGSRNHSAE